MASQNDSMALTVPVERAQLALVEHPCIVRNVERGIKSLGGEHQLEEVRMTICLKPIDVDNLSNLVS